MYDVAVVGGGILGLATGRELLARRPRLRLAILEKEATLASHQSTNNSGVIHSGIYYRPGSLRLRLCREGAQALRAYCDSREIPWRTVGKLIVATSEHEVPALDGLYHRGTENGIAALERLDARGIEEREPHCRGLVGLYVPETGVVDFARVAQSFARDIQDGGGEIVTDTAIVGAVRGKDAIVLRTVSNEYSAAYVIACAGLGADGIARVLDGAPQPRIEPMPGDFLILKQGQRAIVRGCIYPVPSPNLPFLGAHVTPRIDGSVWLGPSGASRPDVLASVCRFLPELTSADVSPGPTGMRAQGVDEHGRFLDDFVFESGERWIQVRNAPSPAATSSMAIARHIASMMPQP